MEQFPIGKQLNEETAEAAAVIVVRGAQPLSRNSFKIQIVKALVKNAILGAAKSR